MTSGAQKPFLDEDGYDLGVPGGSRYRFRWIGLALVVLVVGGIAIAWGRFRSQDKTWAWWSPPAVLRVRNRDYADPSRPVTLAAANELGKGRWVRLQDEWPMGWPIWTSQLDNYAPTVIFLCTTATHCIPYSLEGGP